MGSVETTVKAERGSVTEKACCSESLNDHLAKVSTALADLSLALSTHVGKLKPSC